MWLFSSTPPPFFFFVCPFSPPPPLFTFSFKLPPKSSRCTYSPTSYSLQDTLVDLRGRRDHSPQSVTSSISEFKDFACSYVVRPIVQRCALTATDLLLHPIPLPMRHSPPGLLGLTICAQCELYCLCEQFVITCVQESNLQVLRTLIFSSSLVGQIY